MNVQLLVWIFPGEENYTVHTKRINWQVVMLTHMLVFNYHRWSSLRSDPNNTTLKVT